MMPDFSGLIYLYWLGLVGLVTIVLGGCADAAAFAGWIMWSAAGQFWPAFQVMFALLVLVSIIAAIREYRR